jgi:hypothetical protein
MSDGEVPRFVPLTLEASEQRVTESSLEELEPQPERLREQ